MKSLKILHIETGRHLYGGALQVLYLMRGLKETGHSNVLVCVKGSEIGRQSKALAAVYDIPMMGELDIAFFLRLVRIVAREKPDMIHVHSRKGADLWGGISAKLTKTRSIITRRVDNPEVPWIARAKYRLYNRVITISEGIRQVLIREGIPREKITCIPSAIDYDKYSKQCDKSWFCREFSIPPDHKAVGMVAQFIPRKGHGYLIEAIPKILEDCPNTRFLFFGKGPLRSKIEQLCIDKGLSHNIHFAGFRTDLHRIYPCLDVLAHPATMEGLGVSLLEAVAAGVPIVAFRAGGIPEVVMNGINGYLVPVGDSAMLAQAIISLLKDQDKAHLFARTGQEMVRSSFSLEQMIKRNMEAYWEVMSSCSQ